MKTPLRLLFLATLFAAATAPAADPVPGPTAPKVVLTFENPANFTDMEVDGFTDKSGGGVVYDQLNAHLATLAQRFLAAGQTLTVTMTDIDLAGAIEPWRGPQFQTIRIVRETYPPRLAFRYRLTGADGTLIKEGNEDIRNLGFKLQVRPMDTDTTCYEKEILSDWMRTLVRKPKAAPGK